MHLLNRRNIRLLQTFLNKPFKRFFKQNLEQRRKLFVKPVRSILVLYSIPLSSPRYNNWNDGFTKALEILSKDYKITNHNLSDSNPNLEYLNTFDFILVKSNWNWGPDLYLRENFHSLRAKVALAIAGVSIPPSLREMCFYDVLFYETDWYHKYISNHPYTIKAFGINTDMIRKIIPAPTVKYDYLSIGAILPHKRFHLLTQKKGRILIVGEVYPGKSEELANELKRAGIEVINFVAYNNLPRVIQAAKIVYITAGISGGGERAVLEARACGVEVEVASDNPKLKELTIGKIYNHFDYSSQIERGIKC